MADQNIAVKIPDTVQALLDAGRSMGAVVEVDGSVPAVVIPQGYKLEALRFDAARVARSVTFTDPTSFIDYVNRYKMAGTLIFAALTDTGCKLVAHLDYHAQPTLEAELPTRAWSTHTAHLTLEVTQEWGTWMKRNGGEKPFNQTEFALFLEDNERVFESPSGADLLELVTTLEGRSNVRFNTAIRLNSGKNKLDFEEDVELRGASSVTTGSLEIPAKLRLLIQPFSGVPHYRVDVRLRYRIVSKALVFWYETVTPHLVIRDAAKAVLATVAEATGVPVLIGG
jgi:uncharacterized protein YfdQ (DUF2303 family)